MIRLKDSWNFRLRRSLMTMVIALGTTLSLIFINLLFQKLSIDIDITRRQIFSLTDVTKEVIGGLKRPVVIYALYRRGSERSDIMEVLNRYESHSPMITVELIDPYTNPGFISRYSTPEKTPGVGSVIVFSDPLFDVIQSSEFVSLLQGNPLSFKAEQLITSAIDYVRRGKRSVVYEITGHGEVPLKTFNLDERLSARNLSIKSFDFASGDDIPNDADILVFYLPLYDLSAEGTAMVKTFLEDDGSVFVNFDFNGYMAQPRENWETLLAAYNIKPVVGLTLETNTAYLNPQTRSPFSFALDSWEHPIIKPLEEQNLYPIFANAIAFEEPEIKKRHIDFKAILQSSPQSFFRADIENLSDTRKRVDDKTGPIAVAVSINERNPETAEREGASIVVSSGLRFVPPPDADSVRQEDLERMEETIRINTQPGNVEFFVNSLLWLADESESLDIPGKSLYRLKLDINLRWTIILGIVFIIIIPLIIALFGIVILSRRKRL